MPNNENEMRAELLKQIQELKDELANVKEQKKYGLVWEEKPEEFEEKSKNALPILKEVKEKNIITNEGAPHHILIEGDNYHSLSVLNYTHKEKVDVIYIDPPYNTGNKSWVYNNNYVEKDDSFKHSKWLSMMRKRLLVSSDLLKSTGVIIAAIDDYEVHTLRFLMDEIFGEDNRLGTICVIHNPGGRQDDKFFATAHEYMLIYAKNKAKCTIKHLPITEKKLAEYKHEDEWGKYKLRDFRRSGANSKKEERPKLWYPIYIDPKTQEISTTQPNKHCLELLPVDPLGIERVWRWNQDTLEKKKKKYIHAVKRKNEYVLYVKERLLDNKGEKPKTIWNKPEYSAVNGTNMLKDIFHNSKIFDFPKSPYLIQDILKIASDKDAIILDFFAGSGTTGHAVLDLNQSDNGNRQFILCTNNEKNGIGSALQEERPHEDHEKFGVCQRATYPRIKSVISGYINANKKRANGLGGNLIYYQTDFFKAEGKNISYTDEDKLAFTRKTGGLIALKENTFKETTFTDYYQIFKNETHVTGIYFSEDKRKLFELATKLDKSGKKAKMYIFSWKTGEYSSGYEDFNIDCQDIPEPILEVYKNIGL